MCGPQQPAKRATDALIIIDDGDINILTTHLIRARAYADKQRKTTAL
jgi:hypothetical protein